MNTNYYALSFIDTDSTGFVAKTTKVLFEKGFNIADSSSTLLQGTFSMIFIVTHEKDYSENEITEMFGPLSSKMKVFKYKNEPKVLDGDHYSISVYGADKPGIVHSITSALADNNLNIIDLQTKITGKDPKVYIMMLEVLAPANLNEEKWQENIKNIAKGINTQLNIKKVEFYEL